ncbi:probable amidase At4g34880, partial [Dendrobium catenatum]|uniref:probable amidase At4g34880 n=1 Tax=Dendrobium catenatum TaxID=906689 RepID=UPI00109FE97C
LKGATLVDNIELKNVETTQNVTASGEATALLAEFKLSLNAYFKDLVSSPIRSLADVIELNNQHSIEERMKEYGQIIFLASQQTNGIGEAEKIAIKRMAQLSQEGMEDLIQEKSLDAVVFPGFSLSHSMTIGGFPIINVPAGYNNYGAPF